MKKKLLLTLLIPALVSCTASVGGSGSKSVPDAETQVVSGSLQENEQMTIFYGSSYVATFAILYNQYDVSANTYVKKLDYVYKNYNLYLEYVTERDVVYKNHYYGDVSIEIIQKGELTK